MVFSIAFIGLNLMGCLHKTSSPSDTDIKTERVLKGYATQKILDKAEDESDTISVLISSFYEKEHRWPKSANEIQDYYQANNDDNIRKALQYINGSVFLILENGDLRISNDKRKVTLTIKNPKSISIPNH